MLLRPLARIPVVGMWMKRAYLRLSQNDGEVVKIESGPIAGWRLHRFIHSIAPHHISGRYDPELCREIERLCRPGMMYWDVGANAGYTALVAAKAVGPSGKVVAFEPIRETARQARRQMRLNGQSHVQVIRAAVSDRIGKVRLSTSTSSDMVTLAELGNRRGEHETAPTLTLDYAMDLIGRPDVVKVDVEGAEALVLEGAGKLLREARPAMLMEMHSDDLARQCMGILDHYAYTHAAMATREPINRDEPPRMVVSTPQ